MKKFSVYKVWLDIIKCYIDATKWSWREEDNPIIILITSKNGSEIRIKKFTIHIYDFYLDLTFHRDNFIDRNNYFINGNVSDNIIRLTIAPIQYSHKIFVYTQWRSAKCDIRFCRWARLPTLIKPNYFMPDVKLCSTDEGRLYIINKHEII